MGRLSKDTESLSRPPLSVLPDMEAQYTVPGKRMPEEMIPNWYLHPPPAAPSFAVPESCCKDKPKTGTLPPLSLPFITRGAG